jgi:hypothetical protein
MGNCKYCGKPAGLFRGKHEECEQKYLQRQRLIEDGKQRIVGEVMSAIKSPESFDVVQQKISQIEESSFVPPSDRPFLLVKGWEACVEQFLEDGILDENEEKRLIEFKNRFALSQNDLDKGGAYTRVTKAAVLRDVLNGILPKRVSIEGNLPINLQKSEQIVWVFPNSRYLEDKTRRQYVGGYQGVSLRIMKGVYYRVGAFKGHPVEHTERVHIDTGIVVTTNKHIYFAGPRKSFRIPYSKIVSFEPYSDGIGVMRDAATAKPQIFVTGDGWFIYNLVTNLSRL